MSIVDEYVRRRKTSKEVFERAREVFPGGFTRAPFVQGVYPTFMARAQGCKMWDVDGNEYIDYVNNYGPLLLGHNHPSVVKKVDECKENGLWSGAMTKWEVELAEKVVGMYRGIERMLFTDSGSAAVGKAVRGCRYVTGKKYVAYKATAYHGAYDSCWPLVPEREAGIPRELIDLLICLPLNDGDAAERIIRDNKDRLACVLNEPTLGHLGHEHNNEMLEYNKQLREITENYGIPMVMDEIVTGFRYAPGGYGERFGVVGDYTALNKVLGHGMPLGAFGSSEENMKYWAPSIQSDSVQTKPAALQNPGTLNDWKLACAAGLGAMSELKPELYQHLEHLGDKLRTGLKGILSDLRINAQVVGVSSIFHLLFIDEKIRTNEQVDKSNSFLYRTFELGCMTKGINLGKNHHSFLSSPMTDKDIDHTLDVMREVLTSMKPTIETTAPNLIEK